MRRRRAPDHSAWPKRIASESASLYPEDECQHGYTTTISALGGTTFTGVCTASVVFASQLLAERRPGKSTMTSTVSPRHPMIFVSHPLIVNPGHPTVTGRATSYTVSSGTSGQKVHASLSCVPSSPMFTALLFSDGERRICRQ